MLNKKKKNEQIPKLVELVRLNSHVVTKYARGIKHFLAVIIKVVYMKKKI